MKFKVSVDVSIKELYSPINQTGPYCSMPKYLIFELVRVYDVLTLILSFKCYLNCIYYQLLYEVICLLELEISGFSNRPFSKLYIVSRVLIPVLNNACKVSRRREITFPTLL